MIQIRHIKRLLIVSASAAVLVGCVPHLNEQQCKTMNWRTLGFTDGMHGQPKRNLTRDIADCAKFKIDVNIKAYNRGWRAGTRQFCQPSNGYQLGVDGRTYYPVCPTDMAARFERSWRRGLRKYCIPSTGYNLGRSGKPFPNFCAPNQVVRFRNAYDSGYRIYSNVRTIQGEINDVNGQIYEVARTIRHKNRAIGQMERQLSGAKKKQKKAIRSKINGTHKDIRDLNRRMNHLSHHRDILQQQLNRANSR